MQLRGSAPPAVDLKLELTEELCARQRAGDRLLGTVGSSDVDELVRALDAVRDAACAHIVLVALQPHRVSVDEATTQGRAGWPRTFAFALRQPLQDPVFPVL